MLFKDTVSSFIFSLEDLYIGVYEVLNSPTMSILLSIFSFILINIYFIYLGVPILDA